MAHNLHAEKEVEIPASTQVANITELLEEILLHMDNRTLLLSQKTSKKFRDIIQTNKKIQKKLFFTQPTSQEAVALGIVKDDTIVYSPSPAQVMVLNPLMLTMDTQFKSYKPTGQLSKGLLRDLASSRRKGSSWERMYGKSLSSPMPKFAEVSVCWWGPGDGILVLLDGKPLREALDLVERFNAEEVGVRLPWKKAEFRIFGHAMEYRVWLRESRRAEEEGKNDWYKTDIDEILKIKAERVE